MLALIRSLLSIVGSLTAWAQQRQLIQAGEAQAVLRGIEDADQAISAAYAARDRVRNDPDSMRDDPNNRDNW